MNHQSSDVAFYGTEDEHRINGTGSHGVARLVEEALASASSSRYLWTSIIALAGICAARRDAACMKTAAKLAVAVSTAYALEGTAKLVAPKRGKGARVRRAFFSGHSAAVWAVAGVLEREQGRGAGLAAYGAAALGGYSRLALRARRLPDLVAGALLGQFIGRLVGSI